jgi:hypothetical protein
MLHFLKMTYKSLCTVLYGYSTISRKPISRMARIMKILGGIIVMLAIREIGFREIVGKGALGSLYVS